MTSITLDGAEQLHAELGEMPAQVNRAIVRAINRALGSGRTVMVRAMAEDLKIRQADLRDAMPIREASLTRMVGSFGASLKLISLFKFGARQTQRGVTANTGRGRKTYAGAFIQRMPKTGHVGVFMRKGRKRLPIRELFGPSLGHVFAKFRPMGEARTIEAFEQNFDHELAFARSQGGGDAGTD